MTWHLFVSIAFLICAYPLYSLARGKVEDWCSFAEHSVRLERRAASQHCRGCAADDICRAARCAASIPRYFRARLIKRARARVSA